MRALHPEIEPYDEGLLDVGDGQRIHWEVSGSPTGRPAVVLHGGPGSGSSPAARRLFDPERYRVVLFDQRGCGRSTPHAGDLRTDLGSNTTWHLLSDVEALRVHLGIDRWLVLGGSWGTTLGLAYAERHPERVTGMVLVGVTTTRRSEIDWLVRGVAPLLPAAWEHFRAGVPEPERDGDLVAAYRRLLHDPSPGVRARAAASWHDWETALLSVVDPDAPPPARFADPAYSLARARIVTHYFGHGAWLDDGALLRDAHRLAGIPGVLVQATLDIQAPAVTAWQLARAWPDAKLVLVPNVGHAVSDPGLTEATLEAIEGLLPDLPPTGE